MTDIMMTAGLSQMGYGLFKWLGIGPSMTIMGAVLVSIAVLQGLKGK